MQVVGETSLKPGFAVAEIKKPLSLEGFIIAELEQFLCFLFKGKAPATERLRIIYSDIGKMLNREG